MVSSIAAPAPRAGGDAKLEDVGKAIGVLQGNAISIPSRLHRGAQGNRRGLAHVMLGRGAKAAGPGEPYGLECLIGIRDIESVQHKPQPIQQSAATGRHCRLRQRSTEEDDAEVGIAVDNRTRLPDGT